MKKIYVNTWANIQELGTAISALRAQGYEPKTLSGAVSACIKVVAAISEAKTEDEAVALILAIKKDARVVETKRLETERVTIKSLAQ